MTRSRDLANFADSTEFTAADNTKLDGIEASATADQTNAEIKTAVQAGADIALGGNPTTTTQSAGNNTTRLATTAFTQAAITALVDSSPASLNTLNELAAALGDDANFSTTVTNSIATKLPLAGGAMTGAITTNSTFDGRDVAADGVLATNALPKSGGTMTGTLGVSTAANNYVTVTATNNNTRAGYLSSSKKSDGTVVKTWIRSEEGGIGSIFTETNHNLGFATNNAAPQMTLSTSGNLGIGTTAPESEMHLTKSTSGGRGGTLTIENSNSSVLNNEVQIALLTDSGASVGGTANARIKAINTNAGNGAADITFTTWNGSAEGERLRITSGGNVGINTAAPAATLHIKTGTNENFRMSSDSSVRIQAMNDAGDTINTMKIGGSPLIFLGSGGTERMRIDSSGNLSLMTDGADLKLYYTEPRTFITNSGASVTIKQIDNNASNAFIDYSSWTNSSLMRIMNTGEIKVHHTGTLMTVLNPAQFQIKASNLKNGMKVEVSNTNYVCYGSNTSVAANYYFAYMSNSSNAQIGSIYCTTSSVAYNTSSDYRLKENVDYTWDATTRLKQLKPARFNFIVDDTNTLVDGFLAHEAQAVVPECATGTHNEVDNDGNAVMQGIDQSKLVPLLVKTIQELEARITALEA